MIPRGMLFLILGGVILLRFDPACALETAGPNTSPPDLGVVV